MPASHMVDTGMDVVPGQIGCGVLRRCGRRSLVDLEDRHFAREPQKRCRRSECDQRRMRTVPAISA